ncbi:MAG: glycoside hydrolase family 38 C-terminal domain-containing protein [Acidimicrobiales bacterium]
MTRRVAIVPHTHWDREWYASFQTFRLRLVELLDELLPRMEADPSYAHFLLDGQMAVIDDYLAIRPDAEETLRTLNQAGRLAMGPWYILMDEFLVSGESMIRNLQLGFARAERFGGAMEVGYLPDMFGHVGQMPQLLRLAGLEHAVVWRGVPAAMTGTAFWWEAPDGSRVRAEYLPQGYGNGAATPRESEALVRRLNAYETEQGDRLTPDEPILWMNGTDHQMPQAWLGRVVDEINSENGHFELDVTGLADYLAGASTNALGTITGEMRSGARANLLMGVGSNRVDVKVAAARAERELERRAEPLCALFPPAWWWPQALFDTAWLEMIRNSAHDSICACSHDEVCEAVIARYAEARQIAEGLGDTAVKILGATLAKSGPVVVNPSARSRSGLVEVVIPGVEPISDTQLLSERLASALDTTVLGRDLSAVLGQIRSQQFGPDTYIIDVEVKHRDEAVTVTFHADAELRENLLVDEVKRELYALGGARPDTPFHIRVIQQPSRRLLARVTDVPGYGWQAWEPTALDVTPVTATASGRGLTNGLVTLEVDANEGSFSLNGIPGFDRLVDDGDHGDTYNYSPPDDDQVIERPERVSVELVESGPLRGQLKVVRTYKWPERIDDETRSRVGNKMADVTTLLELRAGEGLVRITTRFNNTARDHRLRSWFPLPERARSSKAECAFAIVERPTSAEGGPTEVALPTYPSRRFVRAGGLTVLHEGLLEYELVDLDEPGGSARELALTLLRATGMLSRVEMTYRPLPAGPPLPLEGAQVQGHHTLRYCIAAEPDANPWTLVDDAFLPLEVTNAAALGTVPDRGSALTVSGAEVSSLTRRMGEVELRVFNPTAEATTVTIEGRSGKLVNLRDTTLATFETSFPLGPWEIATARLNEI